MINDIDCIVAGAGVVGLAIGRSLAVRGMHVAVVERTAAPGTEISGRNSEVIHAGLYYPVDSLKTRLCIQGNELLYDYCASRGIGHARIGKLIVATSEDDIAALECYLAHALQTGVDLKRLSTRETRRIEPAVECRAALFSPGSGIIDTHALLLSLIADIEAEGGIVAFNSGIKSVRPSQNGFAVTLDAYGASITCRNFINSAGLHAQSLARRIEGLDKTAIPAAYYAIGHYYSLAGPSPFNHLVYPVGGRAGLGIHVTLDLHRRARFGPDVRWLDQIDYRFDDSRREEFVREIARYYPAAAADAIEPAYTGIRPKLAGPGQPPADFMIAGPDQHKLPGVWNLFGIESPGLTASLAIGEYVAERVA